MKRFLLTPLLVCLLLAGLSPCQEPKPADPAAAVIRIKSHGASGVIIATNKDKSWILSCAHMLEDSFGRPSEDMRNKKFVLDGPAQPYAAKKLANVRLLAFDHKLDLSLLEIDNGPFTFIPVAPPGHAPSGDIRSLGYDDMAWPITNRPATILSTEGMTTFTREKPWHGRSGGGLIDYRHRVLIGVVQGYEVGFSQRGVYVSHAAVLQFLGKAKPDLLPKAKETPAPWPLSKRPHRYAPLPQGC